MRPRGGRRLGLALVIVLLGANTNDAAPVRSVTDTFFGATVADPYRYMESQDPGYTAWKTKQLAATAAMLAKARRAADLPAAPVGGALPRITDLAVVAGHVFYMRHTATSDELMESNLRGGDERSIATDRTFAPDGSGALGAFAVSNDAKTVAVHVYAGKQVDSDIHIIRTADGSDVEAPLHNTIFDYVNFTPDGSQIVYARAAKPMRQMSMPDEWYDYGHKMGSDQHSDVVIFGAGVSPLVTISPREFAFVDPSGPQVVAEVRDVGAGGSRFYTAPLETLGKPGTPWRPLGTAADAYTDEVIHGTTVDLTTSAGAPNYAVVRASLRDPFAPQVVLPPSDTVVVSGTLDFIPKAGIFCLNAASDADYVQLLDNGMARMVRVPYSADPKPIPVPLPLNGSIVEAAADQYAPGALIHLTSWTDPGDVYAFDPARGSMTALGLVKATNASGRVAEELTAKALDGTPIGVSVVHRPGIMLDGTHPLILQVAGAYGFSMTPDYRLVPDAWLARGGIYAVAHVRGGGELGEAWHRAGMGKHKRNTWTDLIAVAKRLVALGYTSPQRLNLLGTTQSYLGGIASSIAIGRAIEESPDLFAAAVVDAPVFDMLRSERTPLGKQSVSEFGTVESQGGFAALFAMSPYEHVRADGAYPPILVRSFSQRGSSATTGKQRRWSLACKPREAAAMPPIWTSSTA